jgi:hypothetical protein
MLLVRGVTYRLDRTAPHCYSIVRLLDDQPVGTFSTRPVLRIHPLGIEDGLMRDVVRAALRSARLSTVMHVAPVYRPEGDADRESVEPPASGNVEAASSSPPPPKSALR